MAATGLSVAAAARRRPKTPGGDRAENGVDREGWPERQVAGGRLAQGPPKR